VLALLLISPARRTRGWSKDRWMFALAIILMLGVPGFILTKPLRSSDFAVASVALIWLIAILRQEWQTQELEQSFQNKLVLVLSNVVRRITETRLVPLVLDLARQVPLPRSGVHEPHASWERAEEDFLTRLLPRLTIAEARALSSENQSYLSQRLMRDISEEATVAILLTLASAGERGSTEVAQLHLESPSPQVREAAREYLHTGGTI
jgi:hypothetical protein